MEKQVIVMNMGIDIKLFNKLVEKIEDGESIIVAGPNDSGKSDLINLLLFRIKSGNKKPKIFLNTCYKDKDKLIEAINLKETVIVEMEGNTHGDAIRKFGNIIGEGSNFNLSVKPNESILTKLSPVVFLLSKKRGLVYGLSRFIGYGENGNNLRWDDVN